MCQDYILGQVLEGSKGLSMFILNSVKEYQVCDVCRLEDFHDESLDEIKSSHTLKYFKRKIAARLLAEWFRVLKCVGSLYESPHFETLVQFYSGMASIETILGPLLGVLSNPHDMVTHFHETV